MRAVGLLLAFSLLVLSPGRAFSADSRDHKQVGFGFGGASPYPVTSFPYALTLVIEGTYRTKFFGLSILATATSSPRTGGTYWFGSNGGYQQTFLEPRLYLSILHLGFAFGLNLSAGGSGTIQSVASYGPMFGLELPVGSFSIGVDARYLLSTSPTNPSPFSTVLMFRFRI